MRAILVLLPVLLLAGCTDVQEAKKAAEDAKAALEEAQADAREVQARYDRIKSATIVREESLNLTLTVVVTNGTIRFDADARRGELAIPNANLTRLPTVLLEASGVSATCDPLACSLRIPPSFPLTMSWAEGASEKVRVADGATLSRADAKALVTTAAGDVTA